MGRKDLLIHKLEMACHAAGFQNAQEIVQLQVRALESHFGRSLDEIDMLCGSRKDIEALENELRVTNEQRFMLENMSMAKDAWSATARYFKKVYDVELGQPPLNVVHGVSHEETVGFTSMRGKE